MLFAILLAYKYKMALFSLLSCKLWEMGMKQLAYLSILCVISPAFILFPTAIASAEDNKADETGFVDLDGDGFDDYAPDENGDGIPDEMKSDKTGETDQETENSGQISAFAPMQDLGEYNIDEYLPNSERFGRLEFTTRAQSLFRGGFDIDKNFGPGNGIGSGALSGCAGGVCH
jgi:hypothetical protein